MQDQLVGVFALVFGLTVACTGLRLWLVMLSIEGLVAGLLGGAAGFQAIFGDGFLSSVTGWLVRSSSPSPAANILDGATAQ
jgi:hypothetical protein